MLKYQRISNGRAARLYDMFETAFDVLPLACLITAGRAAGAKVFCVHGGLCKQPDVTLEDLQAIRVRPHTRGLKRMLMSSAPPLVPAARPRDPVGSTVLGG